MSSRCSSVTLSIFTYRLGCRVTVTKSTNLQNVNVKGDLLQSLPLRNKILQLNNKAVNDNYNTTRLNQWIIIRPVNKLFNHWPHVTGNDRQSTVSSDAWFCTSQSDVHNSTWTNDWSFQQRQLRCQQFTRLSRCQQIILQINFHTSVQVVQLRMPSM